MVFKGEMAAFMADTTRLIDVEGAFRSGKTTAALWKVYASCVGNPGINWLICRYSDGDTQTKLKPPWRVICNRAGARVKWDSTEMCDIFPNGPDPKDPYEGGSKVYIFGIKSQDQTSRYGKFRGMTLAGIYCDQTEELPHDVFLEMMGRLSQSGMPHQWIGTPNPPDENHWLANEFPEDNHILGRKYYSIPIHANAHNLPPEAITGLEQAYPVAHPKHRSAVLGRRGLNVIGKPVYGGDPERGLAPMFNRTLHERRLTMNPMLPLCEAIDFGKHHPCVVWAQFTPYGGIHFLGGLLGQNIFLEDFVPIMLAWRARWFPSPLEVQTCCDPAGSHDNSQGVKKNGVSVLRDYNLAPMFNENANEPAVRYAMVERIGAYMRRRTPQGEAFGVNNEHWMLVSAEAIKEWKFLTDGFEAGYVWDEHFVSVGSKQVRKPKKDGWYEHGQNCAEYLELSFGGAQQSQQQIERHAERVHQQNLRRAQQDNDKFRWRTPHSVGRGGY
jgi:hypothetical protein